MKDRLIMLLLHPTKTGPSFDGFPVYHARRCHRPVIERIAFINNCNPMHRNILLPAHERHKQGDNHIHHQYYTFFNLRIMFFWDGDGSGFRTNWPILLYSIKIMIMITIMITIMIKNTNQRTIPNLPPFIRTSGDQFVQRFVFSMVINVDGQMQ